MTEYGQNGYLNKMTWAINVRLRSDLRCEKGEDPK